MDKILIEGGLPLKGTVRVSGSKNAALPILIATLLTDEPCTISHVPHLKDIDTVLGLLSFLGKMVIRHDETVVVEAGPTLYAEAPYDLVRRMRASVVVMGPLLARLGTARVSFPGGCAIGSRPIDIHLKGFEAFGAKVSITEGYVELTSSRLSPAHFKLPFPSVGATQNLILTASLIPGKTVLENVAREPENTDLIIFLQSMGVRFEGIGSKRLVVIGQKTLHGASHEAIADRIEAGTFMIAGAFPGNDVQVEGAPLDSLQQLIRALRKAGASVEINHGAVRVKGPRKLKACGIQTQPHPGFPTDLQAQWMALMCLAKGKSAIREMVFENRFLHVAELQRMRAQIRIDGNTATVQGVSELSGAPVMISDLRAGAALVLAALVAKGETEINRVYHLDRGYSSLEKKFSALGAKIKRTEE